MRGVKVRLWDVHHDPDLGGDSIAFSVYAKCTATNAYAQCMDSFLQLLFFLHPERFVLGLQASCRSLRVDGIGIAGCEYPSWAYHHLPPFCALPTPAGRIRTMRA